MWACAGTSCWAGPVLSSSRRCFPATRARSRSGRTSIPAPASGWWRWTATPARCCGNARPGRRFRTTALPRAVAGFTAWTRRRRMWPGCCAAGVWMPGAPRACMRSTSSRGKASGKRGKRPSAPSSTTAKRMTSCFSRRGRRATRCAVKKAVAWRRTGARPARCFGTGSPRIEPFRSSTTNASSRRTECSRLLPASRWNGRTR